MKTWVRKTLSVGVLAAGALLFAPMAAQADAGQVASDNNGILNATQIIAPLNAPINIAGVGVGILGEGVGSGEAGSWGFGESGDVTQASTDNNGVANGTQAYLPVNVPVNIAGIGVGVLGEGTGEGSAWSKTESKTESGDVTQAATDNNGVANATQAYLPVNLPINIAGVGIGILGEGWGEGTASSKAESAKSGDVTQASTDNNGVANGTQVYSPLNLPINIAGVGLGVLGEGSGTGTASSESGNSAEDTTQVSSDNNGVANGTQVHAPVNAPVCVAGIGIGVLGEGHGEGSCSSDSNGGGNGGEEPTYPTNPGTDPDTDPGTDPDGDTDGDYGDAPRSARAAKAEATPLDGLTQGTNGLNLGGLDLLNTLR